MYFCLAFVLGVIFSEGGQAARVQPEKVVASAGGSVILSCRVKIPPNDHVPTVEWSKEGLNLNVVFLYRDGCETFEMKNHAFEFRTSLFMREVKNGNVSLRISNVRPSDAGTYQCLIIQRNGTRETTKAELVVVSHTGFNFKMCCILGVISTVLLLFGISIYIWKTCCKIVRKKKLKHRKSSDTELNEVYCETSDLLTNMTENTRNRLIEDLKIMITDLESVISRRNETINQRDEIIKQRDEIIKQRDETIKQRDETIHNLQEHNRSTCTLYQHDKATTIQSSSESLRGSLLENSNQPSDLNTKTTKIPGDHYLKKNSENAKSVHQKHNANSSPGRGSKKKSNQSGISVITTSNASKLAADNKKKLNNHPVSDPLINPSHSSCLIHRRNSSWPSLCSKPANRYTPLAELPEQ